MPSFVYWIIGAVLGLVLIIYIIITVYTFGYIFKRAKRETPLLEVELEKTHYAPHIDVVKEYNGYFENINYERITIESVDGLKLVGNYYNNNSDKTIIFVHGYKATPLNNFAVPGYYFYKKKYNLLMIVQRAHGDSEGKYITFGNLERKDCVSWVNKINELYKPSSIVLYGISMGAASISMSLELGMPENVKALILDCGFTNAVCEIKNECKKVFHHIPYPIIYGLYPVTRLIGKFGFHEGDSTRSLSKNKIPALFIHGTNDKMVPYEMGVKNYEACNSEKEFIKTDAEHAMSIYTNKEEIEEKFDIFLKKYVK